MARKFCILLVLLLTATISIYACKGGKKVAGRAGPGFDIVEFCTNAENLEDPQCIQACVEDPSHPWCEVEQEEKFTCPDDGSFKGINPFSGQEVSFPETPAQTDSVLGVMMESATSTAGFVMRSAYPLRNGEFHTILAGKLNRLYTNLNLMSADLAGPAEDNSGTSADLGTPIVSVATTFANGQIYAVVGTIKDIKIVPLLVSNGVATIQTGGIQTIGYLGGIVQVVAASSSDISGSGTEKSLPPGMFASVNVPPDGAAKNAEEGTADFVYFVNASGDVWRIKSDDLIGGGCIERLYSAAENPDKNNHPLAARRIAVAGQYVALITSTVDDKLSALADVTETSLNDMLGEAKPSPPLEKEFYRFVHRLARPNGSDRTVYVLDLLTSSYGALKEVTNKISSDMRYQASDLLIKGERLYIAAYKYDINSSLLASARSDLAVAEGMAKIWNAARAGTPLGDDDEAEKEFITDAGTCVIEADLTKEKLDGPDDITVRSPALPAEMIAAGGEAAPAIPMPIFTTIAASTDNLFIRGENGYLARGSFQDLSIMSSIQLGSGMRSSPWMSIFDSVENTIISSFITDIERLNPADNSATTIY